MAAFMPAWRPLDATHSVRLLSERPRGGRVVALCVSPHLAGRPEGARLAVGLVRRWTEGGLGVVLADGDLARPILHLTLGLPNVKGLADLLLVGDPWQSLVLPTSVPGLRLIPAGGGAPATSSQAARDRLADLCLSVPADGSALVVFAPLGTMLAEWVVEVCTDVVVLSGEDETVSSLFNEDEDRIRAHVGPPLPQHRPLEPMPPARMTEVAPDFRSAGPAADEPAGAADAEAREVLGEGRQGKSATSRIEDRWAEAAALLRARREAQAAGAQLAADLDAADRPRGKPAPPAQPPAKPAAPVQPPAKPTPPPGPAAKPAAEAPREEGREPGWVHGKGLVFRPAEPKPAEPRETAGPPGADAPLPLWSPPSAPPGPPVEPGPRARTRVPEGNPPPPIPRDKTATREPLPERPLRKPEPPAAAEPPPPPPTRRERAPQDPLATPPIMMAEWDRFGDEDESAHRSAQRKKLLVRALAALGGVAVIAGAVWVWSSTRAMPPYEARSSALPRATIPSAAAPGAAAAPAGDTAQVADSALVADSLGAAETSGSAAQPTGGAAAAGGQARPAGAAAPAAVPETRAPHQRYSWSMAALGTMDAARSMVERLRRRAPGEAFIVAPIVSDGRTLYRVLGGLAADREELVRIREPLGQTTGQPAGTWLVREAPLAFSLQDFDAADGASAWVAELARSGVPAYALMVERDDGSRVWRVYAGAYANEAEAVTMRALIDSAGIRGAALVERKGRAGG